MLSLKDQAIQTALKGDWENAITLNEELLQENPSDIDTLNRLAFAYAVVGKIKDAKATYQKVIAIDKQNPIALKNLKKFSGASSKQPSTPFVTHSTNMFLEESGKTKVIDLLNIAEASIVSHLITGETLVIRVKRNKIFLLDSTNHFIGMLPDNIGKRLIKFIDGGNKYEAYIKAASKQKVTVFMKETLRAKRFKNQPSFIATDKSALDLEPMKRVAKDDEEDEDEE